MRVGPEPTTDRFTALLSTEGGDDRTLPGHALAMQVLAVRRCFLKPSLGQESLPGVRMCRAQVNVIAADQAQRSLA